MHSSSSQVVPCLPRAVAFWGVSVVAGVALLGAYHAAPADPGDGADHWPGSADWAPDSSRPTLLVFLHPQCPCSLATVAELAKALTQCEGRVAAHAFLLAPRPPSSPWPPSPLQRDLEAIPGIDCRPDPGGVEARRFGVRSSGQVLLFASDGRLLFRGGITAGRGHQGDNHGRETLVDLAMGSPSGLRTFPVFGCSLTSSTPREPVGPNL